MDIYEIDMMDSYLYEIEESFQPERQQIDMSEILMEDYQLIRESEIFIDECFDSYF